MKKSGSKKMGMGGMARMMPGASRRMMAQEEAAPMKKGGKVKAYAAGGVATRGKGAATKGFKARGPMG